MLIKLSKLFYILLILYYGWFQAVFFQIQYMSEALGVFMLGFIVLHAIKTRNNILKLLSLEYIFWLLFLLTSYIFIIIIKF